MQVSRRYYRGFLEEEAVPGDLHGSTARFRRLIPSALRTPAAPPTRAGPPTTPLDLSAPRPAA
ncbi:hypothetical protein GCM10010342_44950 [Streptomyces anulatus]|nr:hypothetical protein GCM10010342_44950 [Streptomyces anulatus]